MKRFSHSMMAALAAMISAASVANAAPPAVNRWEVLQDMAAPTGGFTMKGGTRRTLGDFNGQVVLLNLWASWCTPCLRELPTLDALEKRYAGQGLVVLPMSLDGGAYEKMRTLMDEKQLELPHAALDTAQLFSRTLANGGLPTTYLIDRKGVLRARYAGATDWLGEAQVTRIEALLKE